jgi:FlgD Ig-like domain/Right handed beta helix region
MSSAKSRFWIVLGALSLALSAVAPAGANVISVPGDSPTIQGGINLALPGDSVVVASGVYPEHLNLRSNVSVFGQDAATTIVDGGDVAIDVVRAINITSARFQGFTVTGAISGGGLPGGAGVFVNQPSATIVIADVIATGNDFGIAVFNGFNRMGPDILGCVIHGNTFWGVSDPGNGMLSSSIIYNNRNGINQSGNSCRPQIIGNTVWGNSQDGYSYWNDFAPTVVNNIFAANGGYGLRERAPGTFVDPIVNFNLFWDNTLGNYFDVQTNSVKNTAADINAMPNAENNLVADPLLCNPPADFHLCADSPAIGAGQGGVTIGALGVGCGACAVLAVNETEAPGAAMALTTRPNPLSTSTVIAFDLATAGHATLRVYDATGRAVRTLLEGAAGPGHRELTWDGRAENGERAPAGVYLLALDVDGVQVHRKVTLLAR